MSNRDNPPIESDCKLTLDGLNNAGNFKDLFSLFYEYDVSVFEIVFVVANGFGLLDNPDNKHTLSFDDIASILLKRLTASSTLPLYFVLKGDLVDGKV